MNDPKFVKTNVKTKAKIVLLSDWVGSSIKNFVSFGESFELVSSIEDVIEVVHRMSGMGAELEIERGGIRLVNLRLIQHSKPVSFEKIEKWFETAATWTKERDKKRFK